MKTIKFSAYYPKLHNQTSAELLAVRMLPINGDTPSELLAYDTTKEDGTRFKLKPGVYLQLIFLGNLRIPFCTIRPAFPESKVDYYLNSIGEIFNIEIQLKSEEEM